MVARLLCVSVALAFVAGSQAGAQDPAHILFQDDFESYAVGTTPGAPWSLVNWGAGPEHQVVTDATAYGGTRSMKMRGSAPMYAADLCVNFEPFIYDPSAGMCAIVLECAIRTPTVLGNDHDDAGMNSACVGPGLQNYASRGAVTVGDLCTLQPGRWYRLTVKAFPGCQTHNMYVDGEVVGASLPIVGGCTTWSSLCLHAGWDFTDYFFDDVKVYYTDEGCHTPIQNKTWSGVKSLFD